MKRYFNLLILMFAVAGALHAEVKPRVGVLTFNAEGLSEQDARALTEMFKSSLFHIGKYRMIDRSEMEAVFDEFEYSQSGCASDSCVLKVGRMLTAQYMVFGNVFKMSLNNSFSLTIHLKNIETAELAGSSSRQFSQSDNIQKVLEEMANELSGKVKPQAAEATSDDKRTNAGDRMVLNADGVEFAVRWCPPGSFTMGSSKYEAGRHDDEGPLHKVNIRKGFWMMETEVTQELYEAVMGSRPSFFSNAGKQAPVESVSWHETKEFAYQLSLSTGYGFEIPTEARWEYACRAGTAPALYNGEFISFGLNDAPVVDEVAWYGGNCGVDYAGAVDSSSWADKQYEHNRAGTLPVKQKKPNPWGLYDMLGNVYEWCADWYAPYAAYDMTDPTGPPLGQYKVRRGGSWDSAAAYVRSAERNSSEPHHKMNYLGIRLLTHGGPAFARALGGKK